MKSRAFMIFFISAILTLIAFPATSRAVTFPITYEGTVHVTAALSSGGGCEGDEKMKITLNADGTLKAEVDMVVRISGTVTKTCQVLSASSLGYYLGVHQGKHYSDGTFSITMYYFQVTGTFDDMTITGTGSGIDPNIGGTLTYSFTLQATNQPPKITLEPATYPDFQMNILEGEGFTIKIRKEDGVMDGQGNWKIDWPSVRFNTNGVDNSTHFINTAEKLWIFSVTEDKKEARIKITPDPAKFMSEQNVFNIQWNGEHKIELYICDTEGHCGKSEYSIYFGPFALLGEIKDLRCTERKEILDIGSIIVGNMAYASPDTYLYMALINADKPDEYWCVRFVKADDDGNVVLVWLEGEVQPIVNLNLPGTLLWTQKHLQLSLYRSFSLKKELKEFPAGNYKLLAFVRDFSIEASNGDIKEVKTCSLQIY